MADEKPKKRKSRVKEKDAKAKALQKPLLAQLEDLKPAEPAQE